MWAPGSAYALSVNTVPITRKSLAWLLPCLLLELDEEELGDCAGGAEDDESGCWPVGLRCELAGGGGGCWAGATPARHINAAAHTAATRIIEDPWVTRMNRSSPCPIRTCGIVGIRWWFHERRCNAGSSKRSNEMVLWHLMNAIPRLLLPLLRRPRRSDR